MMRGRIGRRVKEAEVDLTPMLDVVFILLIFFIVTAVFTKEQAIGLEPPPPNTTSPQTQGAPIVIYVNEGGLIRVDDRITDIGLVRANIERLRAATPDAPMIILADPLAKSGLLVRVRDDAYAAGFTDHVNLVLSQAP